MDQSPFYGRISELGRLRALTKKQTSSLVVIKGRRRIGKSRLILEFGKNLRTLVFTGLPPAEGTTAGTQREYFVKQLERLFGIRGLRSDDWDDIFWNLSQATASGEVLIVFDEINWMGSSDSTFLGKLKSAWDLYFKENPKLLLILSGSVSSWIEKNILNSTGFMGRVSLELTLDELPLSVCNLFWRSKAKWVSAFEKFKILSVTGGVPRYLEEIDPDLSAEENIYQLAFLNGGLLVEEFDRIFSDLFSARYAVYKKILERLAVGSATLEQICEAIRLKKGGVISGYIDDLVETGYIAKDQVWNIQSNRNSSLCKFRLRDNYLRFYLKYIEPQKSQILKGRAVIPVGWSAIMGIQFENLILNNATLLFPLIGLDPKEIVNDGPYFQRASKAHLGCQIDYLIHGKFNTLYVCEIKFSKTPIGVSVIQEVQQKIEDLARPKNFSFRPVLIHVNGVTDGVVESEFFSNIIDFGTLMG